MTCERMILNRFTIFTYLYSTHFDVVFHKIFFGFFKRVEGLEIDLFEGALIAETMELFHGFHFFASFGFVGDVEHFFEAKGTGAPDDVADVVLLADVVEEEEGFGMIHK